MQHLLSGPFLRVQTRFRSCAPRKKTPHPFHSRQGNHQIPTPNSIHLSIAPRARSLSLSPSLSHALLTLWLVTSHLVVDMDKTSSLNSLLAVRPAHATPPRFRRCTPCMYRLWSSEKWKGFFSSLLKMEQTAAMVAVSSPAPTITQTMMAPLETMVG